MAVLTPEQVKAMRWPVLTPAGAAQDVPAVVLNRPVCVVGSRRGRVNLLIEHPLVSKTHALIVRSGGTVYVRDLASVNHVYVNGSPVRESVLAHGDALRIGPVEYSCAVGFREKTTQPDEHSAAAHVEHRGAAVAMTRRSLLIGTRRGCEVLVDDPVVNPVHAVLFERDGRHFLRDLGGELTTFVDGSALREAELKSDCEIRIGAAVLRFRADVSDVIPLVREAMDEERPELFDETAEVLDSLPEELATIDDVTSVIADQPASGSASGHPAPNAST